MKMLVRHNLVCYLIHFRNKSFDFIGGGRIHGAGHGVSNGLGGGVGHGAGKGGNNGIGNGLGNGNAYLLNKGAQAKPIYIMDEKKEGGSEKQSLNDK